jgi:putative CocE/NonD family hydrolase
MPIGLRRLAFVITCLGSLATATATATAGTTAATTTPDVQVREAWIPMSDGVRLAATLYVPAGLHAGDRVPAVFEYLPYRKDEMTTHVPLHAYFARHGYASARVDIRGTGRSEGLLPLREYSQQEQRDAEEVIAWLARQDWSSGSVGMFGISWGGFNSLQLAMRNPPALKAIIAIDATEQLFHDDVHFIDGLMHVDEYELNVDLTMAVTRSPDFPTDETSLAARFDRTPWIINYKQHPRDGAFWDEPERPLSAIKVPVFMIGGFLDGYRDSIPRLLEGLQVPAKALLGPWNHSFPHDAVPGPAIEWRDQAVEWWDHWLRGVPNGALAGPRLAVYMNHWYPPDLSITEIPGEWRAESGWPPRELTPRTFFLRADHSLGTQAGEGAVHTLAYRPAATQEGGGPDFWWGDVWGDQRSVDAYSLSYDSAPLREPLTMLGRPRACLRVASTAPSAHWFVRLSDVAPDGSMTLVTGAGIAGAQRDSARAPAPLVPGQEYRLCVDLHLISWVFPAGHKLHVAVSNALWPMIWPTPYSMSTTLAVGSAEGSQIELPLVPAHSALPAPVFHAPEPDDAAENPRATAALHLSSDVPGQSWTVSRDPATQQASVDWRGGSSKDYPWGTEQVQEHIQFRADDLHPEKAASHGEASMTVRLKDRELLWRTLLDVTSDAHDFRIEVTRELTENGKLIRRRQWQSTIPRDGL